MRPDPVTASWGGRASRFAILVHGGAGDVRAEKIPAHVAGCERAAKIGAEVLEKGGSALDAVTAAVTALEDDPLFNAGTGACLHAEGGIELDAAVMVGEGLRAGAVAAMPTFKNPIAIARRVMEASRHVLLAGEGAARFAVAQGFERVDEKTMITEAARARLEAVQQKKAEAGWAGGTVGAVARDASGRVAAATSTGGMVNKLVGRIGDSPLIGAGTYADDESGACSTTGHGEAMIRVCLAKAAIDRLRALAPEAAAREVIALMHARTNETGGLILVGRDGALGLARTTRTMTWAACSDAENASGS
jgi:beta-aspartyl-peptidase (threonine type)